MVIMYVAFALLIGFGCAVSDRTLVRLEFLLSFYFTQIQKFRELSERGKDLNFFYFCFRPLICRPFVSLVTLRNKDAPFYL